MQTVAPQFFTLLALETRSAITTDAALLNGEAGK